MFLWLVAGAFAQAKISSVSLNVLNKSQLLFSETLKPKESTTFELNENFTLKVEVKTTFKKAPKSHVIVMECGQYSVSYPMTFRDTKLSFNFLPNKLARLYKHSEKYNLRMMIADPSLDAPLFWDLAKVDFIANGEVVDNFTDVEWDFNPPEKTPSAFVTKMFTMALLAPCALLVILLLKNGINFGYFPRNFIDAIVSLMFVAGLGGFFLFFVYFWKYVHFEDMFKYLLMIVPVLALLLRGALIGRAKMAAIKDKTD